MPYLSLTQLLAGLEARGIAVEPDDVELLRKDGYYHGFKEHMFYKHPNNKLPFSSYKEIHATIEYDRRLKGLFFDKIIWIETSIKNIALAEILDFVGSEDIDDFFSVAVMGLADDTNSLSKSKKSKFENDKMRLMASVHENLYEAAQEGKSQVLHFHRKGQSNIPLWAYFDLMTMGDFGNLLSCLKPDLRERISVRIGFDLSFDTGRKLIFECIYILKTLRNAIAHDLPVFDVRFRDTNISKALESNICRSYGLKYFNMDNIADYMTLIFYLIDKLSYPDGELLTFLYDFKEIAESYRNKVSKILWRIVLRPELKKRVMAIEAILTNRQSSQII